METEMTEFEEEVMYDEMREEERRIQAEEELEGGQ